VLKDNYAGRRAPDGGFMLLDEVLAVARKVPVRDIDITMGVY